MYVQFQQCKICIAVIGLVFALLHNVVLKNSRGLRIVSIQTVEDIVDMLGSVRRIVKRNAHLGGEMLKRCSKCAREFGACEDEFVRQCGCGSGAV